MIWRNVQEPFLRWYPRVRSLLCSKASLPAIMIDPAEWNATTYEVEMLRHLTLCDWVALEVRRDPNLVKIIKTKEEWISLLDE